MINISISPNIESLVRPFKRFISYNFTFPKALPVESSFTRAWTVPHEALVERIVEIIASYRISGPNDRYEELLKPRMLDTVRSFVAKQEPINMVLPAYPFKSPNHNSKVLGSDPDVGERMSLQHLNSIGACIQQVYPSGGYVTVVSDGACYNDLLGVSDEEVFNYAKSLQHIAERLGLKHLRFTDVFEFLDGEVSPTTAEEYSSRVGDLKQRLFALFLPPGYNFDKEIESDNNALSTYRGYMKFLSLDLATFYSKKGMSKSAARKHSSKVARGMIERGKAFSSLVATKSPLHVRLSIHASDNTGKLSVALLPHKRYSTFPVTPWHNTPYLDATSVSLSLSRKPTADDVTYKICKDALGLSFLCADVPIYSVIDKDVDQQVTLHPLYPFGLKVQVPKDTPIAYFNAKNIINLAKLHSPIIFEGLDPMQYTPEAADDFRRVAGDGLSLSILHEGIATISSTAATSYFSQIPTLQDGSQSTIQSVFEGAAALDDARYPVLHQWQAGHAIFSGHPLRCRCTCDL